MAVSRWAAVLLSGLMLSAGGCGGGSSNSMSTPPPPPPPPPPPKTDPLYLASAPTPFSNGCDAAATPGTLFANTEIEPYVAADPLSAQNFVAVWQQDRWSTGGARGIVAATSSDGGRTWSRQALPFSRCGGGTTANGADFERASNPWVTIGADGTINALAIAFTGAAQAPGSRSAVLAVRSTDGGGTWSTPRVLIADADSVFNDKGSISADPTLAGRVYAVWDRLTSDNTGPTMFARSDDGGASWSAARSAYDPGVGNQTISNALVVLPNGTLVVMFLELDGTSPTTFFSHIAVIRSSDDGATWSAPIRVADALPVGTRDPDTGTLIRDSSLIPEIAVGPGGKLYVVWQDSRFSNGVRDAVALSQSNDGGTSWSAPARVNGDASAAAFSPTVHVRADGVIGVSYYDFRPNTTTTATLLTDYWLARSSDGASFSEALVTGPFDLAFAPVVTSPGSGYFLGDYQGLTSSGNLFVPLFARTNSDAANRTDVFAAPAVSSMAGAAAHAAGVTAATPSTRAPSDELRRRSAAFVAHAMQERMPNRTRPQP